GCGSPQPRSPLYSQVTGGHAGMTYGALRIRVRDMARRFSGVIEVMADDVAANTTDLEVRKRMLLFKMNGIPQMQQSLLQLDPVGSLIDGWALIEQLRIAARVVIPAEQMPRVTAALDEMESEIQGVWAELTDA